MKLGSVDDKAWGLALLPDGLEFNLTFSLPSFVS